MITVKQLKCKRCDHVWLPRKPGVPVTCPKCGNPYWNRKKEVRKDGKHEA